MSQITVKFIIIPTTLNVSDSYGHQKPINIPGRKIYFEN